MFGHNIVMVQRLLCCLSVCLSLQELQATCEDLQALDIAICVLGAQVGVVAVCLYSVVGTVCVCPYVHVECTIMI